MPRTKTAGTSRFEKFHKLSSRKKKDMTDNPNPKYPFRKADVDGRDIWAERGIAHHELGATNIPGMLEAIGWESLARTPPKFHEKLVREFYAAMVPEVFSHFSTVVVRNHRVTLKPDYINEHFNIVVDEKTAFVQGIPRHEFFNGMDGRLAAPLRRDGSHVWDITEAHALKLQDLHTELGFLTVFIKHNVRPSSHRTVIAPEVARLLFCVQNGMPLNIGEIIHHQILEAGMRTQGILPFPCLISQFCKMADIVFDDEDPSLESPRADLGRTLYNQMALRRGQPLLPEQQQRRQRRVKRKDPEGEVGEQVPIQASKQSSIGESSSCPAWFEEYAESQRLSMDQMRGDINLIAQQQEEFRTEMIDQLRKIDLRLQDIHAVLHSRHHGHREPSSPPSGEF